MVWSPPAFLSGGALALWVGVAIFLYYTAYTLAYVPHLALGAELSNDHHERTRVFGGRGIFNILGVIAAAGTIGLSGVVLQLGGYEANAVKSESSITAIKALFSGIPLVLQLVAITLLLRFRLNENEHQRIRAELDRRTA